MSRLGYGGFGFIFKGCPDEKLLLLLCFIMGCSENAQPARRMPLLPTFDPSAALKALKDERSKLQPFHVRQAYLKVTAVGGSIPNDQHQLEELDLEIKRSEARYERLRYETETQMRSLNPCDS